MAAEWWTRELPPLSKYTLSEHLRGSFWANGFANAWFTCEKAEPPYACQGVWQGQSFEIEWEPRQYLRVKADEFSQTIADSFTAMIGLRPLCRYQEEGKQVVEWRQTRPAERLRALQESSEVENLEPLVELA